jgi:uncharacterized protein (UPF0261 family)
MPTIAILGTLDSKGHEHAFVAECIRRLGATPLLIDAGCLAPPQVVPDVAREVICPELAALPEDRGQRVAAMAAAVPAFMAKLVADGRCDGLIALGGGGGTAIATAAMRALPTGFPKVMVSTLAGGNVAAYVGATDIVMVPSIVDVAGLNRVSRRIFENAAGAICGMAQARATLAGEAEAERPLVVASMFGNTTACVDEARRLMDIAGYETLVFHATGTGGRTMESLIASGMVAGVLDLTTTEWADEHVGGILGAGPTRMDAAAKAALPCVIAPGCLDMVNFGEPSTVPAKFNGRRFYHHNPQVTLMRTTPEECAALGRILAAKANAHRADVAIALPRRGISIISAEGQPFHDPVADAALFEAMLSAIEPHVQVIDLDITINDPAFADACVRALLAFLKSPA